MPEVELSQQEAQQKVVEALAGAGGVPTFGTYEVTGEKLWASHVIAVERLIFKAGAKLIFDPNVTRRAPNVFVFAREIVSEDQEQIGLIGWADAPPVTPPPAGNGASGTDYGHREGQTGGNGDDGPAGLTGESGANAPSLTIVTGSITGGLLVSLQGEDGGAGGTGGTGGQGGQGGHGNQASQALFDCSRGAGDGAQGGRGGGGGAGGAGGRAGSGGTFTLISELDSLAELTRLLRVDLNGGQPGTGGAGGAGGRGGQGGPGGKESLPHCRGNGSQGGDGAAGDSGGVGAAGQPGSSGTFYVGGVQADALDRVLR